MIFKQALKRNEGMNPRDIDEKRIPGGESSSYKAERAKHVWRVSGIGGQCGWSRVDEKRMVESKI